MSSVMIVARLAWMRLRRGKAKWVTAVLATVPPLFSLVLLSAGEDDREEVWSMTAYLTMQLLVLLAVATHLSPAVGEELESRTYTYLWSRPMRRSALLFGKLIAVTPAIVAAFALTTTVTWALVFQEQTGARVEELVRALGAVLGVALSGAALSLATSAVFPRHPLAFVLAYVLLGEQLISFVPMLQKISISFHAAGVSGAHPPHLPVGSVMDGVIGLVSLSVAWLALAVWRVERAEYALPDG